MAFSTIARKKAAPLAALIRKLALNDARVIQAASIQATRSFNTKAMGAPRVLNPFNLYERLNRPESKRCGFYKDEDENRYEVRVDMPGLGKEHIKLSVEKNFLTIKAGREEEKGEEEDSRRYYSKVYFRNEYKLKEIEAEMKNGILKIVVPKVKNEYFDLNVK